MSDATERKVTIPEYKNFLKGMLTGGSKGVQGVPYHLDAESLRSMVRYAYPWKNIQQNADFNRVYNYALSVYYIRMFYYIQMALIELGLRKYTNIDMLDDIAQKLNIVSQHKKRMTQLRLQRQVPATVQQKQQQFRAPRSQASTVTGNKNLLQQIAQKFAKNQRNILQVFTDAVGLTDSDTEIALDNIAPALDQNNKSKLKSQLQGITDTKLINFVISLLQDTANIDINIEILNSLQQYPVLYQQLIRKIIRRLSSLPIQVLHWIANNAKDDSEIARKVSNQLAVRNNKQVHRETKQVTPQSTTNIQQSLKSLSQLLDLSETSMEQLKNFIKGWGIDANELRKELVHLKANRLYSQEYNSLKHKLKTAIQSESMHSEHKTKIPTPIPETLKQKSPQLRKFFTMIQQNKQYNRLRQQLVQKSDIKGARDKINTKSDIIRSILKQLAKPENLPNKDKVLEFLLSPDQTNKSASLAPENTNALNDLIKRYRDQATV